MKELISGIVIVWVVCVATIGVLAVRKRRRQRKIERLKMVVNFQDSPEEW